MRKPIDVAGLAIMTSLCLLWGVQQLLVKSTAADISPMLQMMLRSAGAAVLVWLVARYLLRDRWTPGLWRGAGLTVGLLYSLQLMLLSQGLLWTSASHMTVFLYTAPFFAALGLHVRFAEERIGQSQALGMLLAFAGIVVTFLSPDGMGAGQPGMRLYGDLLGVCAGASWGFTLVVVRSSRLSQAPATQTLFYQLAWGTALLLPAAWLTGQTRLSLSQFALGSVVFQVVVVACASHLIWYWMLKRYLASRLGTLSFMTPLFAVALGAIFWHEPVDGRFLGGTLLALTGLVIANFPARRGIQSGPRGHSVAREVGKDD
ncbi:DMT family transporter [Enterobacterales bacterium AW_CKDN230030176-1A_HGKHYDSX7]